MKKGFTRIELLVVIAVISISFIVIIGIVGALYSPVYMPNDVIETLQTRNEQSLNSLDNKGCEGLRADGAPADAYGTCRSECEQIDDVAVRNECLFGN